MNIIQKSVRSEGLVPEDDQVITYTAFGKVKTISENSYSSSFIYVPGGERARMTVSLNGSTILTRWYPTGSYIKETAGGVAKEYTFIEKSLKKLLITRITLWLFTFINSKSSLL